MKNNREPDAPVEGSDNRYNLVEELRGVVELGEACRSTSRDLKQMISEIHSLIEFVRTMNKSREKRENN